MLLDLDACHEVDELCEKQPDEGEEDMFLNWDAELLKYAVNQHLGDLKTKHLLIFDF